MKTLRQRIGNEWLFCDGGMGTLMQNMGLLGGELPETWNLSKPENILKINQGYYEAGCDIVNTNTFGANRLKYDNVEEIVTAAVNITKQARDNAHRQDAYVALDIGPTGKLLEPMGDLPFEEAIDIFAQVVKAGTKAGADLVVIETMSDSYEAKAAILAAKENCDLPILVTTIYDEKGKLLTGGTVKSTVAMLEGLGVDALGVNCGLGPKQMFDIVKELTEVASLPIVVNPNAGLPRQEGSKTIYDVKPYEFAQLMSEIADMGVQIIGGCCGTTPEFLKYTIDIVKQKPFKPNTPKHRSVVSSYSQAVEIGPKPIIVGERVNPTGKKRFKQALRDNDLDYIMNEALQQEEAGAHVLDVNVGLPEIDEPAMLERVVQRIQSLSALPLQIDTSDIQAMERALRIYNGKPMLNSVNGKQESMEQVFPLAKKYGAVVVGLCLDEQGIPETAQGRFEIAKKIYETAASYGISKEDIVIDGLAMTVSSDTSSALVTLETLRRVRDELGGHTTLGVSNISFGLPQREIINSNFFTLAMNNGLSCAIINPNNEAMMKSYRSFLALMNLDPQCLGYIEAYANTQTQTPKKETSTSMTLFESIERGMAGPAVDATKAGLETRAPLELINEELIPALDKVGQGFEKGTIFLPQLLMSADAAKAAFEVVKQAMAGQPREMHGKVIIATVKGDIHDIGKNIVKVLLENYGYDVIDLGKDVPPEVIVDTAIEQDVELVGLSALMTTTVVSMEETIQLLNEKKPGTKTVVGGAVMTQEYADAIHADHYAKDAMATVRYANQVFHVED